MIDKKKLDALLKSFFRYWEIEASGASFSRRRFKVKLQCIPHQSFHHVDEQLLLYRNLALSGDRNHIQYVSVIAWVFDF